MKRILKYALFIIIAVVVIKCNALSYLMTMGGWVIDAIVIMASIGLVVILYATIRLINRVKAVIRSMIGK